MDTVSLIDIAGYLPENRVPAEFFAQFAGTDRLAENIMFRSPRFRHHVAPDESAVDMAERAVAPISARQGSDAVASVDILITHTQLPDLPILGTGGELARRIGLSPEWVIDLHNGGCASFVYMIKLARQIMQTSSATSALIVNVQNSAGQIFVQPDVVSLSQASVPGDGAAAALLTKSTAGPVLGITCRTYPEYAGDMTTAVDPPRKYWEPGTGQIHVGFTESKITKVLARGNRLVPEVALSVCSQIGVRTEAIDAFVTNQPNRLFLRNWRDALELPEDRHPDSFDECGNLFGAGIPVTLDIENRAGRIPNGSLVMMAGFAHAGDFAGAAAVRWGAAS
ncbi:3-oxoacyl-ACP synthase [Rhodococcus sp. 14-2483-1-1]|uniref:3-oxoacyl-ACP synthase III family protein n=1 Tax=Rhodococcus sp. 14-2483-1-1 TaxID=2023148 RepID=UPI000B9A42DE|nr:3-oxoacyl-[acyl-carrier-protein] synthase III C-terminal domain-containing protein [Rhodococcus sp. 14-2483-1-1]OZF37764.1 3-oxoacyl-ACP synthase [Rhodococcus sp. 14-2483-1-1]